MLLFGGETDLGSGRVRGIVGDVPVGIITKNLESKCNNGGFGGVIHDVSFIALGYLTVWHRLLRDKKELWRLGHHVEALAPRFCRDD